LFTSIIGYGNEEGAQLGPAKKVHTRFLIFLALFFFLKHRGGQQAALARGTTRRYRGTGVNASGRVERSTSDDDEEEESDEEEGRERVGFDRLRSVS
jgi:hypothetical protein